MRRYLRHPVGQYRQRAGQPSGHPVLRLPGRERQLRGNLLLRRPAVRERPGRTGVQQARGRHPLVQLVTDQPVTECQLAAGDSVALYTDGITESFNEAGEEFGEQRLIDSLWRHRDLAPQAVIASIVDEVRMFSPHEQYDDITLIVAKCRDC